MKKNILIVILILAGLHGLCQSKIKIACVGNSITWGLGMADREHNSYPAQLQNMLGAKYHVRNFGHSGATLVKGTKNSYWDSKEYRQALDFHPDIVFIKLGTNDSKAEYASFYKYFETDYKEMIHSFKSLPSKPRVILLLPVASYVTDTTSIHSILNTSLLGNIIPRIQNVAFKEKIELIDLFPLFVDKPGLFPDKIHPSSIGATIIAKRTYEAVKATLDKNFDIFANIKEQVEVASFNGFDCASFKYAGRDCKVVKPRRVANGRPWVWRARFWGHEPQADISLLERGYHIVYCDVAELFGNTEAVSIWNKFYALMQQCGLAKQVALEGMSRGGVYIYNWALANPGKVACIYADAPVLDLNSWPGGKKHAGGKDAWEAFKKDYQLTEQEALQFKGSPLDHAAKIAKLGFPMLHVVGDADDVVPVKENTEPFEQRVKAAGGDITVIHKPGVNHHPHSLQDPTPITNFILAATNQKVNFAAIASPGAEYRSGAGWTEGKGWWQQKEDIDSLVAAAHPDMIFLGNSITQGTGGHRTYVTHKPGFNVFDSLFGKYKWECAGISGDRTQNVLFRLQRGRFKQAPPRVMVVTIGVNNFIENDSPEEIVSGITTIADWIRTNMPSTRLILTGPLPTGLTKQDPRRIKYEQIHALLAKHNHKGYTYLPIQDAFNVANGNLDPLKYSSDGIHLQPAGYRAWALALQPSIERLLGAGN